MSNRFSESVTPSWACDFPAHFRRMPRKPGFAGRTHCPPRLQLKCSAGPISELAHTRSRGARAGSNDMDTFIEVFDMWAVRFSCARKCAWREQEPIAPPVAVNISATTFNRPELASDLNDIITDGGVPAGSIERRGRRARGACRPRVVCPRRRDEPSGGGSHGET